MKQKIFVFICLLSLVIFSGCGLNKCNTPEEVITKLYSGEFKSADEVRKILYLVEDNDNASAISFLGDEVYQALGLKNRVNYENEYIQEVLKIDHVENLKIEKIDLGHRDSHYKVNGTVHCKDGSTVMLNNKLVRVITNPNEKNGKTKYLIHINPLIEHLDFCTYTFGTDDNKSLGIRVDSYYYGDGICFITVIRNYTDDNYILSDWPKGANVIWGDKSAELISPVTVNSKNNPIGKLSFNRGEYHAVILSDFNFGKIVTFKEAKELLKKNNSLIFNYIIKAENGLPSHHSEKQPLILNNIDQLSRQEGKS